MNVVFIVLIFVVAIAIVLLTDLITAVQVLSILASVAVLYRCFSDDTPSRLRDVKLPDVQLPDVLGAVTGAASRAETGPAPPPPVVTGETFIPDGFYGPEYNDYNAYKTGYGSVDAPMYGGTRSVDDMGMRLGIRRDRSRQCTEGMLAKDANYYKYHFGSEFADYENRPWWGRNEY